MNSQEMINSLKQVIAALEEDQQPTLSDIIASCKARMIDAVEDSFIEFDHHQAICINKGNEIKIMKMQECYQMQSNIKNDQRLFEISTHRYSSIFFDFEIPQYDPGKRWLSDLDDMKSNLRIIYNSYYTYMNQGLFDV